MSFLAVLWWSYFIETITIGVYALFLAIRACHAATRDRASSPETTIFRVPLRLYLHVGTVLWAIVSAIMCALRLFGGQLIGVDVAISVFWFLDLFSVIAAFVPVVYVWLTSLVKISAFNVVPPSIQMLIGPFRYSLFITCLLFLPVLLLPLAQSLSSPSQSSSIATAFIVAFHSAGTLILLIFFLAAAALRSAIRKMPSFAVSKEAQAVVDRLWWVLLGLFLLLPGGAFGIFMAFWPILKSHWIYVFLIMHSGSPVIMIAFNHTTAQRQGQRVAPHVQPMASSRDLQLQVDYANGRGHSRRGTQKQLQIDREEKPVIEVSNVDSR